MMTKILGFPVSCTYDDSFELEIDPVYLNAGIVDIEGIHENGNVSSKTAPKPPKEILVIITFSILDRILVIKN